MLTSKVKPHFRSAIIGAGLLLIGLLVGGFALGGQRSKSKEAEVVARIDDQVITMQELENTLAAQLAKLQEQKYQLIQSKLDELIEGRLL